MRTITITFPDGVSDDLPDAVDLDDTTGGLIARALGALLDTDPARRLLELRRRREEDELRAERRERYRVLSETLTPEELDRRYPPFNLTAMWIPEDEPAEPWEERPIAIVRQYYDDLDAKHEAALDEARWALAGEPQ